MSTKSLLGYISVSLLAGCCVSVAAPAANTENHLLHAEAVQADDRIVFIDGSVRNHQLLSFDLRQKFEVVFLDAGTPLLTQMAQHLKGRHNIKALHVISHGETGAVLTMGGRLDRKALGETPDDVMRSIADALSDDADILFYGCNIAKSSEGKRFLQVLSERTGADVAASTNDTGHKSFGADWVLEHRTGDVSNRVAVTTLSRENWQDKLAVGISVASSTSTLIAAINPTGITGVTYTGTPTILGAFSSNAYGTFTTTGSNLGMTSGAVFGTGNVSQISGSPTFFWDGAGTGNTSGSEFDRAGLTFSFIPDAGVTKIAFRYIMGSEEYNEFVGQNFSDNITIRLNGGIYTNTNVAVVPGTSTGIDIDTINASLNSGYYRDNTIAVPPVSDSVLDGHTTVLSTVRAVVPGTTYSAEIKVADFTDNRYNSAIFVNYFGASLQLDLDSNNSSGAMVANYQTSFTEGGAAVAIADTDRTIANFDTTAIQSATITLTNAQANDLLSYGTMPSGITAATNTSVPGVITVTLTGSASIASYQTAISSVLFSNSSNTPNTTTRNVTVVVNDGATNSNTGVTSITVNAVPSYLYTVSKSVSAASVSATGNVNYTITLVNTGDGNMTGVTVTDTVTQGASSTPLTLSGPLGDAGVIGQFDAGETWVYTATLAITQARLDNGNDIVNTVSVASTQTAPTQQNAQATTTITKSPALTIDKQASTAGPVNAGDVIAYTYFVRNAGNITINSVSISDAHNGLGVAPVPGSEILSTDAAPIGDSTDAAANGTWSTLAPGDTVRFTANYTVTQADIDHGP